MFDQWTKIITQAKKSSSLRSINKFNIQHKIPKIHKIFRIIARRETKGYSHSYTHTKFLQYVITFYVFDLILMNFLYTIAKIL